MEKQRAATNRGPSDFFVPEVHLPERLHHAQHMLMVQIHGRSLITAGGRGFALAKNQALWIPAGTTHELTVHENSIVFPLAFALGYGPAIAEHPVVFNLNESLRLLCMAQFQAKCTLIAPPIDLARQILSRLRASARPVGEIPLPRSPEALAVAQFLLFSPGDGRDLQELADMVHSSSRTIQRSFRNETGMTLRQWRQLVRIHAAKELLRAAQPLEAVARQVGYTNVAAFHRAFKECAGVTPAEYTSAARDSAVSS